MSAWNQMAWMCCKSLDICARPLHVVVVKINPCNLNPHLCLHTVMSNSVCWLVNNNYKVCYGNARCLHCSRVHPLQSRHAHLPSSEWQCSSMPVVLLYRSHWHAILTETKIIHTRPFILQPRYCQLQDLSSLRRQYLKGLPAQYHCARFSDSVLRLFSSYPDLIIWHSEFCCGP